MEKSINGLNVVSWILGSVIFTVGGLNLFLVHPVPGVGFMLLSFLFFPPTNAFLQKNLGFGIPFFLKLVLFLILMMFTLGVSDLGDMIDKL